MLDHEVDCRSHNTGCDGDCDCRSFAERNAALAAEADTAKRIADDLEPMHSCSQCGWSGRSFHACEGVPGGFSDNN